MTADGSLNLYSPVDLTEGELPVGERVFISHRRFDKPLAAAVAALLEALGVHYWFGRDDEDVQQAAALGLAGDQALVHAIERGIQHSSRMLGLLSAGTSGSWWVPYELGVSRSRDRPVSFLVLSSIREMQTLPAYVRLAANYWSVDELVRWAASLRGGHFKAQVPSLGEQLVSDIQQFVPRQPPAVTVRELATQALAAIDRLAQPTTWEALRLTSTEFDWLPTAGGLVRDLTYDLLAPLAFFQLQGSGLAVGERDLLQRVYRSVTQHKVLAALDPRLPYDPEAPGWRERRYLTPASAWRQGLSGEQLLERVDRFLLVPALDHGTRLATREEFKAEFDRIRHSNDEHERRSLGVLVNPLFGFTPTSRPVYWRVLAVQQRLHQALADQAARGIFDDETASAVDRFLGAATG